MVVFIRQYITPLATYAVGARAVFQDDVETALIAQGFATADATTDMSFFPAGNAQSVLQGGNFSQPPQGQQGYGTQTYYQGPLKCMAGGLALGSLALTSFETNGVAQTAGTFNLVDIYVPYWNTWTGISVLQGTTVTTNKAIGALYGTNGALIRNSAVAGVLTTTASTFLDLPFTSTINLAPGRYILGIQMDGNTDTIRHMLSANGDFPSTGTQAGAFGTVPATLTTIPVTFTTAQAPICRLYT